MSQGSSRSTRRASGGTPTTTTAASTSTTTGGDTELADLQGSVGNAAVASMLAQETAAKGSTRFSSLQRATLLASTDRLVLASMVFSESTASTEVTDEMRALAAVGQNRSDHMREHPEDDVDFGSTDLTEVVQDPFQFEQHAQSKHMAFNDAARFNSEFASEQELQHAVAAIEAAAEIEAAGNPFTDDYLVFSKDEEVPHADRIDETTKVQYGALTFWAFAPRNVRKADEEELAVVAQDAGGEDAGG